MAEDAVQEALLAASLQWPQEGLPDNPRGWLIQVAARRMTDHMRSETPSSSRNIARRMHRLRTSRHRGLPSLVSFAVGIGASVHDANRMTRSFFSSCAVIRP